MQRLLTPHRPMLPATVNIHEILERVRSLLKAEFPGSLQVVPRLRHQPAGTGRRSRATDSGGAQYRAQCGAGDEWRRRNRAAHAAHAPAPGDAGQEALPLALEIKVIDNGPGIPDDIRERMFYPLVSGREGGSGLG
jgi:two-component system nitrogen regulation sensor histidine kinase GlnL